MCCLLTPPSPPPFLLSYFTTSPTLPLSFPSSPSPSLFSLSPPPHLHFSLPLLPLSFLPSAPPADHNLRGNFPFGPVYDAPMYNNTGMFFPPFRPPNPSPHAPGAVFFQPPLPDNIRAQIEYYFSDENLTKDFFLRKQVCVSVCACACLSDLSV